MSVHKDNEEKKLSKPATIQLSKLVRVVRMIRLTRLGKLYKYIQEYLNPTEEIFDEDGVEQSFIGAKMGDILSRR